MEQKVSSVFKEFSGELKGTYYPLLGMDKATQQQLIDDHFLFKEGDRFLQAANACRCVKFWGETFSLIYHSKYLNLLTDTGLLEEVFSTMIPKVCILNSSLFYGKLIS